MMATKCKLCGVAQSDPPDDDDPVIYPDGVCEDCMLENDEEEADEHDYPDED